jgi:hypothetical protein
VEAYPVTKPVLQALLLADHIYQDKATGKYVICGVFDKVYFEPEKSSEGLAVAKSDAERSIRVSLEFGHAAGSPWSYISLTEVHGEQHFELRYVDLEENTALFQANFVVQNDDPLKTLEIVIPLPILPMPARAPEGQGYRACALELLCDNELIGSHRVSVQPVQKRDDI